LVELEAVVNASFRRYDGPLRVLRGELLRDQAFLVTLEIERSKELVLNSLTLGRGVVLHCRLDRLDGLLSSERVIFIVYEVLVLKDTVDAGLTSAYLSLAHAFIITFPRDRTHRVLMFGVFYSVGSILGLDLLPLLIVVENDGDFVLRDYCATRFLSFTCSRLLLLRNL